MNRFKSKKYLFLSLAIVLGLSLIITAIAKNTFAVTYECPPGFTAIAGTGGGMCDKPAKSVQNGYKCSSGTLIEGTSQCRTLTNSSSRPIYKDGTWSFDHYDCSEGIQADGRCYLEAMKEKKTETKKGSNVLITTCEARENGTPSSCTSTGGNVYCSCTWTETTYECPTGYSEYSGMRCRKTIGNATKYYKCSVNGAISTSDTGTCRTQNGTEDYCPNGNDYKLPNGTLMCETLSSALPSYSYSCPDGGNLNSGNNRCEIPANPVGDFNNCPIGADKVGDTCVCRDSNYIYNSATNKCDPKIQYAFDVEQPSSPGLIEWCKNNGGAIESVSGTPLVKCVKKVDYTTDTAYPITEDFRRWCSTIGGSIEAISGTPLGKCVTKHTCGTNASWNNITKRCVCNPGWAGNPETGCTTNASNENKDYFNGELRCEDGYHEDENDVCVKDNDYSASGVYYISGGKCKPYPAFDGYCVEKGKPYTSSRPIDNIPLGDSSRVKLSCEQIATAWIVKDSSTKDYAAQSILNGRTYYTDSNCTNAVSTSSLRAQASEMCKTPSFGAPRVSTNYNNILFQDTRIKLLNNVSKDYNVVKVSLDGSTYVMKKNQTMCITDDSGLLSKYTIKTSGDGNATATIKGNQFCINSGDKEGKTTFKLSRVITTTSTVENETVIKDIVLQCPVGYKYDWQCTEVPTETIVVDDDEVSESSVVSISVTVIVSEDPVDLKGGFKLIKKDTEGTPLEGVEFLIGTEVKNGEIVNPTTKKTNANGEILLEDLPAGQTYYYQEKATLDGYILDDEIRSLVIEADTILEVNLVNYKEEKGGFRILKIDNFGNPLKNVKFKIGTNLEGTEGTDWSYMTTGEKGIIMVGDLELDKTYYYQEVEAPDGYYLESGIKEIKINDTVIVDIPVVNERYTRDIEIYKTSEDEKPLEGAIIEIYNADDNTLIETGITNKDGVIKFNNLSYGNYYALEKEAPKGYELNNSKHEFTITDLTERLVIPMINYKIDNPITADLPIIIVIMIGIVGIGYGIYKYRMIKLNSK